MMVQKSGVHQLRLAAYPNISQVVVWDFLQQQYLDGSWSRSIQKINLEHLNQKYSSIHHVAGIVHDVWLYHIRLQHVCFFKRVIVHWTMRGSVPEPKLMIAIILYSHEKWPVHDSNLLDPGNRNKRASTATKTSHGRKFPRKHIEVTLLKNIGISPCLIGNTSPKSPFSVAMLDYRSVKEKTWISIDHTSSLTQKQFSNSKV